MLLVQMLNMPDAARPTSPLDGHTVLLNPALIVVLDFQDFAQTDCKSTRSVLTNSKTLDPH
jgi:hypothetical protein